MASPQSSSLKGVSREDDENILVIGLDFGTTFTYVTALWSDKYSFTDSSLTEGSHIAMTTEVPKMRALSPSSSTGQDEAVDQVKRFQVGSHMGQIQMSTSNGATSSNQPTRQPCMRL